MFPICFEIGRAFRSPLAKNFLGQQYASGNNFWPRNLSQMVSDPNIAHGQTNQFLMIFGSVCWLISRYPWVFNNVRMPGRSGMMGCQAILPAAGLVGLAIVPIYLGPTEADHHWYANGIHAITTAVAFASYILVELYRLLTGASMIKSAMELRQRWMWLVISLVSIVIYFTADFAVSSSGICCSDEYRRPTTAESQAALSSDHVQDYTPRMLVDLLGLRPMLFNTASGQLYTLKLVEFWSETAAVAALLGSVLTVWYYCDLGPEPSMNVEMGMYRTLQEAAP